jgi:hypothetical protein
MGGGEMLQILKRFHSAPPFVYHQTLLPVAPFTESQYDQYDAEMFCKNNSDYYFHYYGIESRSFLRYYPCSGTIPSYMYLF